MTTKTRRLTTCVALAGAMLLGTFAAPARADDRRGGRDNHGDRGHHDGGGGGGGYYGPPPVVYGPPGYDAPPVVYAPGIGIAVPGVNINIR